MAEFFINNEVTINGAGPYIIVDKILFKGVDKYTYYVSETGKSYMEGELELADSKIEEEILKEVEKLPGTPEELLKLVTSATLRIPFEKFSKIIFKLIQDKKIEFDTESKLTKKTLLEPK